MADINTTDEHNEDGSLNPHYIEPGSEGATDTENKGKKEGGDKGDGEPEFDDTIVPEKPPEIPVRQNVAQHIIARKNEQIRKLESKLEPGDEGYIEPADNGDDDTSSKTVNDIVDKKLAPFLGKLASDADETEFQSLLTSEPEAKKYANHIKAYMAHEMYKGVPPSVIYHHLAFASAQALGAKKKKAADLEASQSRGGGRNVVDNSNLSGLPSAQDIAGMDEASFEKMQNDVLEGKFN